MKEETAWAIGAVALLAFFAFSIGCCTYVTTKQDEATTRRMEQCIQRGGTWLRDSCVAVPK
jgi:hypothetical protein